MASTPAVPLTHVDWPEVAETFVDSLGRISRDNTTACLEFVVERLHDPHPPAALTGQTLTVCRLVMPLHAMIDLLGKLHRIMKQLEANGIVHAVQDVPHRQRPN